MPVTREDIRPKETIAHCPECGKAYIAHSECVPWCGACSWNVHPSGSAQSIASIYPWGGCKEKSCSSIRTLCTIKQSFAVGSTS